MNRTREMILKKISRVKYYDEEVSLEWLEDLLEQSTQDFVNAFQKGLKTKKVNRDGNVRKKKKVSSTAKSEPTV